MLGGLVYTFIKVFWLVLESSCDFIQLCIVSFLKRQCEPTLKPGILPVEACL